MPTMRRTLNLTRLFTRLCRDMSEAEKRKIQKSKGNAENLIQELESGNIYLEDLGKDTVDRLISLLKSKEG